MGTDGHRGQSPVQGRNNRRESGQLRQRIKPEGTETKGGQGVSNRGNMKNKDRERQGRWTTAEKQGAIRPKDNMGHEKLVT
jgi:hypothetical protein